MMTRLVRMFFVKMPILRSVVLFFFLVIRADAQVPGLGKCPDVEVQKDFDPSRVRQILKCMIKLFVAMS